MRFFNNKPSRAANPGRKVEKMRTEFVVTVKHPNGKTDRSSYIGRKWGEEAAIKAKSIYGPQGCEISFFKAQYQGSSFVRVENIEV